MTIPANTNPSFNSFLGDVQGKLLAMGLDAPLWESSTRDAGDYDSAVESCVKTMAILLRKIEVENKP